MQELILSMVRFTAAVALYGIEQIQNVSNVTEKGEDVSKVLDRFEGAFNSLTDVLVARIDRSKRDTLKSVTSVAEDFVNKSFEGINMMDPREVLRITSDFWKSSSDAISDWLEKPADSEESEPKPAADVLV